MERHPDEFPKPTKAELPKKYVSGPTFIGLNATRAQYVNMRWQIVVAAISLNTIGASAFFSLLFGITVIKDRSNIVPMGGICVLMLFANQHFLTLFRRTTEFIMYFTKALMNLENSVDDLYPVYSNSDFPGHEYMQTEDKRVTGVIRDLAIQIIVLWFLASVSLVFKIIYVIVYWYLYLRDVGGGNITIT